MSFPLRIPLLEKSAELSVDLEPGQILFIVGPNGSGKSALIDWFYRDLERKHVPMSRTSAHRQNFFKSPSVGMTPEARVSSQQSLDAYLRQPDARFLDAMSDQRIGSVLFDLAARVQSREHAITQAVDGGCDDAFQMARALPSPLSLINKAFCAAGISVSVELREGTYYARTRANTEFPMNSMSDGERSAFLIAATVLTADERALVLLDEPERHMHRSIASGLLTELFGLRRDCAFVIATHDLQLVEDNPGARVVVTRVPQFEKSFAVRFDADRLDADRVPEDLKALILGARRSLLFVEGEKSSLDLPLYECLFPEATVRPVASCKDVEKCVKGLRETAGHHWVKACGVVDRDFRTPEQVEALRQEGIFALGVHSIESVYYDPSMQKAVAALFCQITGQDAERRVVQARAGALRALKAAPHLAEDRARSRFHNSVVAAESSGNVCLKLQDFEREEAESLGQLLAASNLEAIVSGYPIKKTAAIDAVAKAIGFSRREDYESAVLEILRENGPEWGRLRAEFPDLLHELGCTHSPGIAAEPASAK
jgi:ABC-type branched-subunit amino acid transport system ATPase component